MKNMIHWLLGMQVKDGQAQNFKAVMAEMLESTKGEQETHIYEWFFSEDQSVCLISERYSDSAAAMIHLQSFGNFAERFLAAATPIRFTVLGSPSDQLRQALAGFNPVYLGFEVGFCRLTKQN
jgi:quinol monooxygenase YgiN